MSSLKVTIKEIERAIRELSTQELDDIYQEFIGDFSREWDIENPVGDFLDDNHRKFKKYVDHSASWQGFLEGYVQSQEEYAKNSR